MVKMVALLGQIPSLRVYNLDANDNFAANGNVVGLAA